VTDAGPEGPYRLLITGPAARAIAGRLPEKVATAVYEFVTTTLVENPRRVGKRLLLPPYAGTWSARRGAYRVLYEIDEERRTVIVTAVEHRGDVYRSRGQFT
jgi:mRNA interferase RelE/StbE